MRLTYELAKELKEAGFPQDKSRNILLYATHGIFATKDGTLRQPRHRTTLDQLLDADVYADPTLSELIEACGGLFLSLVLTGFSDDTKWRADGGEDKGTHSSYQQYGTTPEEAVSHLWLALNKKAVPDRGLGTVSLDYPPLDEGAGQARYPRLGEENNG